MSEVANLTLYVKAVFVLEINFIPNHLFSTEPTVLTNIVNREDVFGFTLINLAVIITPTMNCLKADHPGVRVIIKIPIFAYNKTGAVVVIQIVVHKNNVSSKKVAF